VSSVNSEKGIFESATVIYLNRQLGEMHSLTMTGGELSPIAIAL
jgi:hypothetical protein